MTLRTRDYCLPSRPLDRKVSARLPRPFDLGWRRDSALTERADSPTCRGERAARGGDVPEVAGLLLREMVRRVSAGARVRGLVVRASRDDRCSDFARDVARAGAFDDGCDDARGTALDDDGAARARSASVSRERLPDFTDDARRWASSCRVDAGAGVARR